MGASKRLFNELRESEEWSPDQFYYDQEGQLREEYKNTILGTEEGFFIPDDVIEELRKEKFLKTRNTNEYIIPQTKGIKIINPKNQNNG